MITFKDALSRRGEWVKTTWFYLVIFSDWFNYKDIISEIIWFAIIFSRAFSLEINGVTTKVSPHARNGRNAKSLKTSAWRRFSPLHFSSEFLLCRVLTKAVERWNNTNYVNNRNFTSEKDVFNPNFCRQKLNI